MMGIEKLTMNIFDINILQRSRNVILEADPKTVNVTNSGSKTPTQGQKAKTNKNIPAQNAKTNKNPNPRQRQLGVLLWI